MPLYDFVCEGCGPFEQWRPIADPGAHCPVCSVPARRVYSAPSVRRMDAPLRTALTREEHSAAMPEVVSRPAAGAPLHLGHRH
jgi:putative FmdB family regulatory protein